MPGSLRRDRYENRPPTADELEKMRRLVASTMEQGAFGLTNALEATCWRITYTRLCRITILEAGFKTAGFQAQQNPRAENWRLSNPLVGYFRFASLAFWVGPGHRALSVSDRATKVLGF